jgi:type IV pilus assembly protein PilP
MKIKIGKNILFLTILSALISGCSEDNSDLAKYINEVKRRPGRPIEPIPKFSPLPTFRFPENDTRRSPFKPVEHVKLDLYAPDQKRKKEPLEAYPLDGIRFVGILKQGNILWALIKDPSKKIVPVRVGNYMGLNYGRIISIKNNEIKLEETVKNLGKWEKRTTTIHLDTNKAGA